jgi:hypothetical protein
MPPCCRCRSGGLRRSSTAALPGMAAAILPRFRARAGTKREGDQLSHVLKPGRTHMGLILLWLLGIPLPIILILFLLWH